MRSKQTPSTDTFLVRTAQGAFRGGFEAARFDGQGRAGRECRRSYSAFKFGGKRSQDRLEKAPGRSGRRLRLTLYCWMNPASLTILQVR